jgi:hypothetical protein
MSNKDPNYCVLGNGFSDGVDTYGEAEAIIAKNGNGAIYQRCFPDPIAEICGRCGEDMEPELFEGKIIGYGCPACWNDWDRSNVVVGNFVTSLLPDGPKAA